MVLSTIQTASLVVGIVYYLTIMRNTQKTNEQSLKAQEAAEKAKQREMVFQRARARRYKGQIGNVYKRLGGKQTYCWKGVKLAPLQPPDDDMQGMMSDYE